MNFQISTSALLSARDKVLENKNEEIAFVIQGKQIREGVRRIFNLLPIPNTDNTSHAINNTRESINFEENTANNIGIAHSHLSHFNHPNTLSQGDKLEIERRKIQQDTNKNIYMILYINPKGNVEYRGFNNQGSRINLEVINHKGESRISGKNSGEKNWGKDFWGINE
jgi:hypothetical protein